MLNQTLIKFFKNDSTFSLYSILNIYQSPEGKVLSIGNRTQGSIFLTPKPANGHSTQPVSFTSQPSYTHRVIYIYNNV
jgi:hypothetical protein